MSLITRISDLATRMGTECKAIRSALAGAVGDLASLTTASKSNLVAATNELKALVIGAGAVDLSALTTTQKTTIVAAINEVKSLVAAAGAVADGEATTDSAWSSAKTAQQIAALRTELTAGAGAALDTFAELAAALGNDADFAGTVTAALAARVSFDATQTLTTGQKLQACTNIGVGDPETNFVNAFNAALV